MSTNPPRAIPRRSIHWSDEMMDEMARAGLIDALHCMRDPARGGVATTLNEIALSSEVCIEIHEDRIPVREEVKGACEILGLDPRFTSPTNGSSWRWSQVKRRNRCSSA